MKKLTKQQRKYYYQEVINLIQLDYNDHWFICNVLNNKTNYRFDGCILDNFLELSLFNKNNLDCSAFLTPDNWYDNIKKVMLFKELVLLFCIEMCNE